MIQRPLDLSPSQTLPMTTSAGRAQATFRARVSRPKCGGGILLCSVVAMCGTFFMMQMRTNDLVIGSTAGSDDIQNASGPSASSGRPSLTDPLKTKSGASEDGTGAAAVAKPERDLSAGLRRFSNFEEYLDVTRAEGGTKSNMPVVEQGGRNVTIPSLIIVGARRSGTTSLFKMLGQHPHVASIEPYVDGPDGLMAREPASYPQALEWPGDGLEAELPADALGDLLSVYARPYTISDARGAEIEVAEALTIETSPGYLASPLAPYRLKLAMPNVKVVIVLRDPTERYFSELRDKLCVSDERNIEWDDIGESFAKPAASKGYLSTSTVDYSPSDKRCLGEGASAPDLWTCQMQSRKSHRPLLEGLYAGQVERWLRAFDKSQVNIVDAQDLFSQPEAVAADVGKFAGLSDHRYFEFALDRQSSCDPRRRSTTVASAFSKRKEAEPKIRQWYASHNDMVADVIGKDVGWNDRIRSTTPKNGAL